MTFVFYVSRPTSFENQCGSAEKTNKPPKNKHGTSQRKCEMWWSRSVRQRYHWSTTPLMKNCSDESLSCPSAPIKATHEAIETGGTVIHFEEQCTAKNNFETDKFTISISLHNTVVCVEQFCLFLCDCWGQYLSTRTCPDVQYAFSLNFFCFFFLPEAEINACAGRETQIKNVVPL